MIRADVAVIGGGLAARWVASRLGDSASVVRIEPDIARPAPASHAALGIVAAGGHDSLVRLTHAIGEAEARELWRFSEASCRRLLAMDPLHRSGVWRLALEALELEEWRLSKRLLESWGRGGDLLWADAAELESAGVGRGFLGGLRIGTDGVVNMDAVSSGLRESPGVRVLLGAARIDAVHHGVEILVGGATRVDAEVVVVAAGIGSRAVHPFFEDLLHPVRLQTMRARPGPFGKEAAVARHRYEAWAPAADGGVSFLGCRWAEQPEMEAGVEDDQALSELVSEKQSEFVARHLDAQDGEERRAGIAGYCCDGLPLVGPVPGAGRLIALTGWCGWGLSWMGEAVEAVASGILGEKDAPSLPRLLAARRML